MSALHTHTDHGSRVRQVQLNRELLEASAENNDHAGRADCSRYDWRVRAFDAATTYQDCRQSRRNQSVIDNFSHFATLARFISHCHVTENVEMLFAIAAIKKKISH